MVIHGKRGDGLNTERAVFIQIIFAAIITAFLIYQFASVMNDTLFFKQYYATDIALVVDSLHAGQGDFAFDYEVVEKPPLEFLIGSGRVNVYDRPEVSEDSILDRLMGLLGLDPSESSEDSTVPIGSRIPSTHLYGINQDLTVESVILPGNIRFEKRTTRSVLYEGDAVTVRTFITPSSAESEIIREPREKREIILPEHEIDIISSDEEIDLVIGLPEIDVYIPDSPPPLPPECIDEDSDGRGQHCDAGLDCNDQDPDVYYGNSEIWDGKDNNCNVDVDEGFECKYGQEEQCGSDVGVCEYGLRSCVNGVWSSCVGGVGPGAEVCDGVNDENCNNEVDEGCDCTIGNEEYCGTSVGVCEFGIKTCTDGTWSSCVGGVGPSKEICEGFLDENCDTRTDENCECINGKQKSCGTAVGACSAGTRTCREGKWSECEGIILPEPDVCDDDIDNDCNGVVDDDCDVVPPEPDPEPGPQPEPVPEPEPEVEDEPEEIPSEDLPEENPDIIPDDRVPEPPDPMQFCPIDLVPWFGRDPYRQDDPWKGTVPELKRAYEAFNKAWCEELRKSNPNHVCKDQKVISTYRPQEYQDHIRSVWDAWRIVRGVSFEIKDRTCKKGFEYTYRQKVPQIDYWKACGDLKRQLETKGNHPYSEISRHGATGDTRPACRSDHAKGIAIDIKNPPLDNWALYKKWIKVAASLPGDLKLCHYIASDEPHFALSKYLDRDDTYVENVDCEAYENKQ